MHNTINICEYKLEILFLIILLFIINYQNFTSPSIEGFKMPNIGKLIREAGDKIESKIVGKLMGVINPIISKVVKIEKTIAGIPMLIIKKIERFGKNLVGLLKNAVVSPFMTLFRALGNMFTQVGHIIMKIIGKIKSLPNCSALYVYQSIFGIFKAIYKKYMPNFLKDLIKTIYKYTLKIPLDWISKRIGLTDWWDKCFNFNVDDQVKSIKDKFKKVGPEFTSKFGHMNFKDLLKGL